MIDEVARNTRLVALFKAGVTRHELALLYGITVKRVGHILQTYGVAWTLREDPPHKVEQAKRRVERIREQWDCDVETWLACKEAGYTKAFKAQRAAAGMRGIKWRLTFGQWYAIWQASGKLHLRGQGKHGYCMARNGDEGPYAVGNVTIKTNSENSREACATRERRAHAAALEQARRARARADARAARAAA